MKNKISIITLLACAAAGTQLFAEDTVEAFRADSGTTTNSSDATYVGNTAWGADSKALVEKYYADLYLKYAESDSLEWDSKRNAFYTHTIIDSFGGLEKEYDSYDFVFVLDGAAQFTNASDAMLTFGYEGDTAYESGGYDASGSEYFVTAENMVLFAGSSKFTNAGTILFGSTFTGSTSGNTNNKWNGNTPPGFNVFLRNNAVFENSGTISAVPDNYVEYVGVNLFENAKFVNADGGNIKGMELSLYGNSTFENAGTLDNYGFSEDIHISLSESGTLVNTGTLNSDKYNFNFEAGFPGTAKIENRGTMTGADVDFRIGNDPVLGISASFENYGIIKPENDSSSAVAFGVKLRDVDKTGDDVGFWDLAAAYTETMHAGNLNVKNYGTIDLAGTGTMTVLSGVKLTLAEGSTIKGNLKVGKDLEFYLNNTYCTLHIDKDVLNIELTGAGGSEALISGDLDLCNLVELKVSFAEDAVKLSKYEITIWGGSLLTEDAGFVQSSLTGTLAGFGTTYNWSLDATTGVLTAKDANVGEEVTINSDTTSVSITGVKDVATFADGVTEYSGSISGAGSVESSGTLTFKGDASAHTGTTTVAGTFTVDSTAKLGSGEFSVGETGTLKLEGERTFENATSGSGEIVLASGASVAFEKAVGVKKLSVESGATLDGGVSLTRGNDAELDLKGTLVLNADAGEKVSLGGGKVVIDSGAKLDLFGKNGGREESADAGTPSAQVFAATAENSSSTAIVKLANGERISIFENGTVEISSVETFLGTDTELSALASSCVVLYDAANGLTVQALTNPSALVDRVNTSDLSASFVAWALGGCADELENLGTGFTDVAELGSLGGNDPLLNAALGGNAGAARSILNRLSPKSYAAMIAMPTEAFHADLRGISARLAQSRGAAFSEERRWEFFVQAQMISVDNDDASDAPTFDFDRYGVLAGALYRLEEGALLGLTLGADDGEAKIHDGGGKIESTDFRLTAFASKSLESFFVTAGAHLGYGSYDVKRRTDYGNADGDTDGWSAGVFADAGTVLTISEAHGVFATPYVGLAYLHSRADSFSESGNEKAAFDVDSLSGDSLRARLGCEISWRFTLGGTAMRLGLDLSYSHEFLDDEIDVDVRGADGRKISETAYALPEDMFSAGPTFGIDLTENAGVYAGYAFSAGTDSSQNHSANVGFRMTF